MPEALGTAKAPQSQHPPRDTSCTAPQPNLQLPEPLSRAQWHPGLGSPQALPASPGSDFSQRTHHEPGETSSKVPICKVW